MPPPKFRRAFDYDAFFGHTLMCVTGEPVTPTKIAIFYLIRTLFHAHFGVRAVPSLKPFTNKEKTRAFTILYGLIFLEKELSYTKFRKFVRLLNNELGRSIFYHFASSMEKLARGDENIDMLFENSFYTSMRPFHEKIGKISQPEQPFMSSNSFIYIWMKRVMFQYTRTPQKELFGISQAMKAWLLAESSLAALKFEHFTVLPIEIDCSVRARLWILQQLQLVQHSPSQAMPYDQILNWCRLIARRHLDVFNVHLLRAVVHVQLKNPPGAVKSLKKFFDLSMLQFNENATKALSTLRLMAPSQIALRFGPILQGRVHRIFGDHESASFLFKESIQQAQLNNDEICNRMANLELTTNGVLMNGPLLEMPFVEKNTAEIPNDRRVIQESHHQHADLRPPFITEYPDEAFEIHGFQNSLTKLLMCLDDMMHGRYFSEGHTPTLVFLSLQRLRHIYDVQNKARMIENYANAVMSSALIQNGMYEQARRVTEEMMVNNYQALETEAQAVGGVNLIYSLAASGEYVDAFKTLRILESIYPEDRNWMAARHVSICSQILRFEQDFLLNHFSSCASHIAGLESTAPLEWVLRKALLLAVTGRIAESVSLLKGFKCGDVRGLMRIHMQLATIHTGHGLFEHADFHLGQAGKIAANCHFRDASFLVARRAASLLLARGKAKEALRILEALLPKVENFGSYIEKAIYHVSTARCLRLVGKDPRLSLKKCRAQITGNQWPCMEKLMLAELAKLHEPGGMFADPEKASRVCERFAKIEKKAPGPCTWMFI